MEDLNGSQHLFDECKTIEENSLYTAQAHYVLAESESKKKWIAIFIPSLLSGLAGALVAMGLPTWIGIIGALLGAVAAIASSLGVDQGVHSHINAGNIMTSLRHEARQLHEVFYKELSRPEFLAEVRRLADKYNHLRLALPPTSESSFAEARKRIHDGRFAPDFKKKSK